MTKFAISLLSASLLAAAAASAATILGDTTQSGVTLDFGAEPPLDLMVKNNAAPNGTTLNLIASDNQSQNANLIAYTSPTTLEASGMGNGFATVSGPGNGGNEQGFGSLTIDPLAPALGFTAINFNLMPLGRGNNTYFGDITLNLAAGGSPILFENVAFSTNGENKFSIFSNDDRIFSTITFSGLRTVADGGTAVNFASIRQVSIDLANPAVPVVPEPTTWAMMIGGFGLVGTAMRRRRPVSCPA